MNRLMKADHCCSITVQHSHFLKHNGGTGPNAWTLRFRSSAGRALLKMRTVHKVIYVMEGPSHPLQQTRGAAVGPPSTSRSISWTISLLLLSPAGHQLSLLLLMTASLFLNSFSSLCFIAHAKYLYCIFYYFLLAAIYLFITDHVFVASS